jgi:predicted PurR-regulated permease PerM
MTEAGAWRLIVRATWYVLAVVIGVAVVFQVRSVAVQAILAMIISAAISPLADRLVETRFVRNWRWKPGRVLVVLVVYLVLGVLGVIIGVVVVGTVSAQLSALVASLPQYAAEVEQWLASVLPAGVGTTLIATLQGLAEKVLGLFGQALLGLASAFAGILGEALSLVFTLILAVYFAADGERIQQYLLEFVPESQQPRVARVMLVSGRRLGAWVRGQLAVCSIIGALFGVGLALIGVPYATLLAVIAFLGEFVPLVGPFISSIPAIIVAFLAGGPTQGILTVIFCIAVEQLENDLIVPKVMGSATSIHPVAVMLAILAGAQLAGATGALLAVPVAGFVAVLLDEVYRTRAMRVTDSG